MSFKTKSIKWLLATAGTFLFAASATQACTTVNWNGGVSGLLTTINPQNPLGTGNADDGGAGTTGGATARWSGTCALKVTGAGYVQDGSPNGETRVITRFYFLPQSYTGTETTIFRAYAEETPATTVMEVGYDGTTLHFRSGAGHTTAAAITGWNSVEFDWNQGGTTSIWVNADSAVDPATTSMTGSSADTIQSVRLGGVAWNGTGGTISFDAYEMHQTTIVGTDTVLIPGDGTGDGVITVADVLNVFNEVGTPAFSSGQPDCNGDGAVTVADVICAFNKI